MHGSSTAHVLASDNSCLATEGVDDGTLTSQLIWISLLQVSYGARFVFFTLYMAFVSNFLTYRVSEIGCKWI